MTKMKTPKRFFAVLFSVMSLSVSGAFAQGLYLDSTSPVGKNASEIDERAWNLVSQMTLEEKCDYIGELTSFVIRPVERLGIPQLLMADGPQGIRNIRRQNTVSTLYPCGVLTAATWNRELADKLGHGLGQDAKARGISFLLGPGVNIYRAPLCGRNFEYFGEDPYLTSEIAANYIIGVQHEGVIATVKHFAANNQEWSRHHTSSDVDERTLHEVYFPAFRKAVQEAHVGAVMDSYNPIFGVHASEHGWMNIEVLRNMWGFDGILMSDWTSVYSSSGAANGGLDLECPKGVYFTAEKLVPLVKAGIVSEETIDTKVYHILHTLNRFGLLDKDIKDSSIPLDNPDSDALSLEIAREGIVMLENRGNELPFRKKDRVLVLGPNAFNTPTGGGSGFVQPFHSVSVADGLSKALGEKHVTLLPDSLLFAGMSADSVKAGAVNADVLAAALKKADRVVYCAGFNSKIEGEGFDRPFALPAAQRRVINEIAAAHAHLTIVLNAGGGVNFNDWSEGVEAVLLAWYPGQRGGDAIAEVLSGKVSPSGKLPISIENRWEDNPVHDSYHENTPVFTQNTKTKRVEYREGIFYGYKGYEKNGTPVRYPFGYGLSYSKFDYSDLCVEKHGSDSLRVSFIVANTGKCDASEISQVYVSDLSCSVPRPVKELKGFCKNFIKKGGRTRVEITLGKDAFSFYDVKSKSFVVEPGVFEILVGASSADIRLRQNVQIGSDEYRTIAIEPDRTSVIRNPLTGWVMYLGRGWSRNFGTEVGYDNWPAGPDGQMKVRVSDYCGTAYIRTSWSSMEPEEGKYFWNDPDSRLNGLLDEVRRRGMRLAFRIVVDGRDQGQNTPQYVIDAGAKCFTSKVGSREVYTPYPDDKVFQEKYEKFLTAFAQRFNSSDEIDFIDAYGLGKWGEAHSMRYMDEANKIPVYEWITDLYARLFTNIPLVMNYHRVLAAQTIDGWEDAPNPDTEKLLASAISKGYSLRHDAFGMTGYYMDWEKEYAARWRYRLPIIFEGGWITGAHHRYWKDPCGKYREGHPEDVRMGEMEIAEETHVNMMDFRVGNETESWFQNYDLVQRFVSEGGYRLYPSSVTVPTTAESGETVCLSHVWENLGWGYCPNNIRQWHYRYKPAFVLLDSEGKVVRTFVDRLSEPSEWIKGKPGSHSFSADLKGIAPGEYTWAIGIADTMRGNRKGLNIAVDREHLTPEGWLKLEKVTIR